MEMRFEATAFGFLSMRKIATLSIDLETPISSDELITSGDLE
jgi:hypothetical protein